MSRLFESDYLYGLHDPGGEQHMLDAGTPGWIVFTEGIGHDRNNRSGFDYRPYSNRGLGIITRLNNGYYPEGTIPHSRHYADFAQRCANFVANSPGCKIWIIGNEPNYRIERPPAATAQSAASSADAPRTRTAPTVDGGAKTEGSSRDYELIEAPTSGAGVWSRMMRSLRNLFGGGEVEIERSYQLQSSKESEATGLPAGPAMPDVSADRGGAINPPQEDPFLHGYSERFSAITGPGETVRGSATPPFLPQAVPAAVINGQEVITPTLYAQCYRLCRDAIRRLPGHEDDQVLVAAVAPWNNQTTYAGNPNGDWVQYFADVLGLLGPDGCDGMALHTYTHQADANLITSDARMNPPFANRYYEFRAYRDFMGAIPTSMRNHAVYITETDQDVAWLDQNIEWVQRAYGEINWWNQQPGNQTIRALVLYRYPPIDKWVIQGKDAVIEDFRFAMRNGYRWRSSAPEVIAPGAVVATTDLVNLRRTPGFRNKSSSDVVWQMPTNTESTVISGPQSVDGLTWWQVRVNSGGQANTTGWTAEATGTGQTLLRVVRPATGGGGNGGGGNGGGGGNNGGANGDFQAGDVVQTATVVRMRRSPGYLNKPATDIVTDIPTNSRLTVLGGPRQVDGLTWWQVRSVAVSSQEGWMAQKRANGDPLLELVERGGPTEPPPAGSTFKAGDQIRTTTVVRMRQSPGYTNKPANDVVADINQGTAGTVQAGPRQADSLTWWQVSTTAPNGNRVSGWMAEVAPNGATLLEKAGDGGTIPPPDRAGLATGDIIAAATGVRLRNSPGYIGKPGDDVLGNFVAGATVNLIDGPRTADNLNWWRVGGVTAVGEPLVGWSADQVGDVTLLAPPVRLPGTDIPNKASNRYLPMPFQGNYGISQLWGENPQVYSQITYDGVPLRGHNGIDFLTPTGTPIVAVDNGVIEQVVYNDPSGFGHFVKVRHSWGEALYAHLDRINVQVGQQVARGNVLGATGNTGFTFGPHLHFAIRINPYSRTDGWGGFSDPLPYLTPGAIRLPTYVLDGPAVRSLAQDAPADLPDSPTDMRTAIARAPGYAPDQPGVTRP